MEARVAPWRRHLDRPSCPAPAPVGRSGGGGGEPKTVTPSELGNGAQPDYLAFGYWIYEPDDVTDTDPYEFGVFGSSGDPFEAANLAGLTRKATYKGAATGAYYVNALSNDPTVGSFDSDVTLEADFGDDSATGFIDGEVSNFAFDHDVASSLPETVALTSGAYAYASLPAAFGVRPGSTNIFDTPCRACNNNPGPFRGGQIGGATKASVGKQEWSGSWHGIFYGNGAAPTDHPTGVACTFGSHEHDRNEDGQAVANIGLAGAFGARRQ